MLKDLLKEALPLSQFELLCHVHISQPLAVLGVRWQAQQNKSQVLKRYCKVPELLVRLPSTSTQNLYSLVPPLWCWKGVLLRNVILHLTTRGKH